MRTLPMKRWASVIRWSTAVSLHGTCYSNCKRLVLLALDGTQPYLLTHRILIGEANNAVPLDETRLYAGSCVSVDVRAVTGS